MATNAYYLNQFISTTLSTAGGINDSQTTGIKIASTSGVTTDKPGILCLSYSDPIDTTKAEWISYTSIDVFNELQGVTRGEEGFSAKAHSNGVTVAFPISRSHINNLNDALIIDDTETNMVSGTIDDDTMATASATTLATSESTKAYVDNNGLANGWTSANEIWAYASATAITVPSGAEAKYAKGDKIRLKQGADYKYFYVIKVEDTVLTVTGGSDFTVANDTITDNYYSHESSPIGFPDYFICTVASWATTGTAFTNNPTTVGSRFVINGNVATVKITFLSHANSGGTGIFRATITTGHLPVYSDKSFGVVTNVSNALIYGFCGFFAQNVISMCKYDGTAIATDSQYFSIDLNYIF
jgi:hypothetical protein